MAASTFKVTAHTHKAARTQNGHESRPSIFFGSALLPPHTLSLLIFLFISRIAIESCSRSRFLPLSMDYALTERKPALPARLPITTILRDSSTKEITRIAPQNYCFHHELSLITWHLTMSISPSPTFACSGPQNLSLLTQAFVRNGCGIIIVHVTWAAQPTGSG